MDACMARGLLLGDVVALSTRTLVRCTLLQEDRTLRLTWPCRTQDPSRAIRYLLLRLKRAIEAYHPPDPSAPLRDWATTTCETDERLPIEGGLVALGITEDRYGRLVYHVDFLLPHPAGYQPKRRYHATVNHDTSSTKGNSTINSKFDFQL